MIKSFGWNNEQAGIQHDINELNYVLSEALEKRMEKVKKIKGTYSKLFKGDLITYINCIEKSFVERIINGSFNCIELTVKGLRGMKESLKAYV